MKFTGRTALITGGAGGIGKLTALHLAREGADICLLDIYEERLRQAAEEIAALGSKATFVVADVSNEEQVKRAVAQTVADHGKIDILVNCAGISPKPGGRKQLVEDVEKQTWDRVLAINLTGTFLCCQAVIGPMKEQSYGRIINISSIAGRSSVSVAGAPYAATKAGVLGIGRVLARELGPFGITVNSVAPGKVNTEMGADVPEADIRKVVETTPVGRTAEPEEIARAIAFLADEASGFITGAIVDVTGGRFMP